MVPQDMHRPSREEQAEEFIDAVEQIIGGNLNDWQKAYLLKVQRATQQRQHINISVSDIMRAKNGKSNS